jgi:serine/threonine-protein kinase
MYERYYFPELLGTVAIQRKNPVKLKQIFDTLGFCNCHYCSGKSYVEMIDAPNNKLHFLENLHKEIDYLKTIPENERMTYFIARIDEALANYGKLKNVFKSSDYAHLQNWKKVFKALNK